MSKPEEPDAASESWNLDRSTSVPKFQASSAAKSPDFESPGKFFAPVQDFCDSVFERKETAENVLEGNESNDQQPRAAVDDDSSLSLIDLEAVDNTANIFKVGLHSDEFFTNVDSSRLNAQTQNIAQSTANGDGDCKKGVGSPLVLSSMDAQANAFVKARPFSLPDTVSPLPGELAASTPEPAVPSASNCVVNASGDNVSLDVACVIGQTSNSAAGDCPGAVNLTYGVRRRPAPEHDATYIIDAPHDKSGDSNDQPPVPSCLDSSNSKLLSDDVAGELNMSITSSSSEAMRTVAPPDAGVAPPPPLRAEEKKETKKTNARKPLVALNNAGDSRVRTTGPTQGVKRSNRVHLPRMNAAALSRIKARTPPKPTTAAAQDENQSSSLKPSGGNKNLKSRKPVGSERKTLMPPPSNKVRSSANETSVKKSQANQNAPAPTSKSHPTNRRTVVAAGRPSKVDGNVRPNAALLGSSTAPRASISSRINSRLPKPQVVPHQRTQVIDENQNRVSSSTRSRTFNARSKSAPKDQKRVQAFEREHKRSLCVVSLATLLDYVVNRLDGLSAPQLSVDKQQLQRLVTEERTSNDNLSSRVDQLERSLTESRDTHRRDVDEALKRHDAEVTKMKERHDAAELDLRRRLEEITEEFAKQMKEHQVAIEKLKEDNQATVEELTEQHNEEQEQLRREWSDDRQEWERETLELRNSFEAKVKAKVEELIQPYINSYEENKSLRAVLEMKNVDQHKLQTELSRQSERIAEAQSLCDHVTRLEQRNEDLQTQVEEKNTEQRELKNELEQFRRNLSEQLRLNKVQQQRIDELDYRLDLATPPPPSPFNPVFTTSPTAHQHGGSNDFGAPKRTPVRSGSKSSGYKDPGSFATPHHNGSSS